ncbi:MAG: phytoene/squalene synthase family protein [Rubricoccaceae bacterium]|nr:phytoene/squalene synthase family protein [Rubricoccaceae bacterium]
MSNIEQRMALYNGIALDTSRATTRAYSTSFSISIRALSEDIRDDIHAIYGLVRFADEIVDSFFGYDQESLFQRFKAETFRALEEGISTNPVIHAFQQTYNKYEMPRELLEHFFRSMEWDLRRTEYTKASFDEYIVGSAEVVGLMCLKVFVRGDEAEYQRLKPSAIRLGAAFQKVNFLRDLREDIEELGRFYFPDLDFQHFDDVSKRRIEQDIEADFKAASAGIVELPRDARFAVHLAYTYYRLLLRRIMRLDSKTILESRVRVPDAQKLFLWATTYTRHRLNLA